MLEYVVRHHASCTNQLRVCRGRPSKGDAWLHLAVGIYSNRSLTNAFKLDFASVIGTWVEAA